MRSTFLTTCALFVSASAHSIFQEVYVNGVSQGHTTGIRVPSYDGPITNVTSDDMICNGGPNPLNSPLPTAVIDISAGASVTAEWHHTLNGLDTSDSDDPIPAGHLGPVMVYLAKVDDATTETVTGLSWFKIYADGLDSAGEWVVTRLIANEGEVNFTIPSCVLTGQYLMRVELIALHAASTYPGAQLYMECAQINVVDATGTETPSGISFPGAYKIDDPGIVFNLYWPTPTAYTIPGPTVFSC